MKNSFIGFLLVFTLAGLSQAAVPLKAGVYQQNGFTVLLKKRYEVVPGFSTTGHQRLLELLQQRYDCENTGREIYLCSHFIPELNAEMEIEKLVHKKLNGVNLTVEPARGDKELLNEAEAITEWNIPQTVSFNSRTFQNYRLADTGDLQKLFFGEKSEETFIMDSTGEIFYSLPLIREESSSVYFLYLASVHYRIF